MLRKQKQTKFPKSTGTTELLKNQRSLVRTKIFPHPTHTFFLLTGNKIRNGNKNLLLAYTFRFTLLLLLMLCE